MKRSAVRSVLAVLVAILLLCSMALAVGGGVAGAGAAAAGSITGQTAAPSKPQPAETNQPSATVVESPTEAGSEDASDDGETSNGGIFARIAEFFRTLLEPRKDSGEMVEKTFGEIRDAINFGFNTVENTLRDNNKLVSIPSSKDPDLHKTGERVSTPRGSFAVTSLTREQMEAAGYGCHHRSEDGKYLNLWAGVGFVMGVIYIGIGAVAVTFICTKEI